MERESHTKMKELREETNKTEELFELMEKKFDEQHKKVMKMNESLRDYERRVENFDMERKELQKEIEKLKEALAREKAAREELERALAEEARRTAESDGRFEALANENNQLLLKLAKAEADVDESKERSKRQTEMISELQRTIAELNDKIGRFDSIQSEERKERKKVEREKERLSEEVKDVNEHLKRLLKKYDDLKDAARAKENEVKRLEKKLTEKESVMDECVKELKTSHKARIDELHGQVDDFRRKNSQLENENKMQKMRLETSFERESSVDSDYGLGNSFTRSLSRPSTSGFSGLGGRQYSICSSSSMSSIRTLNRRRETEPDIGASSYALTRVNSSSQLLEKERKIAELERTLQSTSTDLNLSRREIEVYKVTLSTLEGEKESLGRQVKSLTKELETLTRKLREEEKKADDAEQRVKKLQTERDTWKAKTEEVRVEGKNELLAERSAFLPWRLLRKRLQEKMEEITHEKSLRHTHISIVEKTRDELQSQLAQAQSELDRALGQLAQMHKTRTTQESIGSNWESQYRTAMSELTELRDENEVLKSKIRRQYRQIELLSSEFSLARILAEQQDTEDAVTYFDMKNGKLQEKIA